MTWNKKTPIGNIPTLVLRKGLYPVLACSCRACVCLAKLAAPPRRSHMLPYRPAGAAAGALSRTASLQLRGGCRPFATASSSTILLSPAVQHLLVLHKISLSDASQIPTSGPKNRLLKGDILAYLNGEMPLNPKSPKIEKAVSPSSSGATPLGTKYTDLKTSNTRKVIAERLSASKRTSPHLYLTCTCPLDNLMAVRSALNAVSDIKVSVNDMVVKALASALRDVPEANCGWDDARNDRQSFPSVDISVAVAVEGGLITPVVKAADRKGVSEIAGEIKDLARRAKEGKLSPNEYQGGSVTVSNLGMFGVTEFSAVLNPPQGCILAIGGKQDQVRLGADGRPQVSAFMTVTLSCDNRVIDEEAGAALLDSFKHYLDVPGELI